MLTVFTPTYNRAYRLPKLYKSLCNQTNKEFTWLVIDDGSIDDTKEMIEKWQKEDIIKIRYYFQENQGKSAAHNKGVELTTTELFTCVDSDDYLTDNAVNRIIETWNNISNSNIVGVLAQKVTDKGVNLTLYRQTNKNVGRLKEMYDKKIITGDSMLVYRTDVIKKYKFPKYKNEKFVPEAYLYDLLDQEGGLYVMSDKLYIAEYLSDGYSHSMAKLIANNPNGYIAYIVQRLKFDKSLKSRFLDSIRYIAICLSARKKHVVRDAPYSLLCILAFPFGYVFYLMRYKKF